MAVRGSGGRTKGGTDREGSKKKDLDQKLVSFFSSFFPARFERNELWNCDFPFFVLFNIKPYLLYWKLQRLLSLMINEFHKAHIKVSLQNMFVMGSFLFCPLGNVLSREKFTFISV